MLIHKPPELSWEICAGIPETWITATQALDLIGEFAPGKSVLWHAGASSVSIAGIQLSKAEGAGQIFVTAGSDAKIDFCKSLGATAGYNYKDAKTDWSAEIMKATGGKGVDIVSASPNSETTLRRGILKRLLHSTRLIHTPTNPKPLAEAFYQASRTLT